MNFNTYVKSRRLYYFLGILLSYTNLNTEFFIVMVHGGVRGGKLTVVVALQCAGHHECRRSWSVLPALLTAVAGQSGDLCYQV